VHAHHAHEAMRSMQHSVRVRCVAGPLRTRPDGRLRVQKRQQCARSFACSSSLCSSKCCLLQCCVFVVQCVCGAGGCVCGGARSGREQVWGLLAGYALRVAGRAHLWPAAVLRRWKREGRCPTFLLGHVSFDWTLPKQSHILFILHIDIDTT
jgi:hypothetical protein